MATRGRPRKHPEGKPRLRAKVTIPGADKPKWVSAYSKAELRRKIEEVKSHYIGGVYMRDVTFHALVIEWYTQIKRPKINRPSTEHGWANAINNHVLPCFPEQQLARAVRRADLQRCLDACADYSSGVTNLVYWTLVNACAYGQAEGIMQLNPAAFLSKPTPKPSVHKQPFTTEEERTLLRVAAEHEHGLIIFLLYYLGVRRGEMLGLKWGDIDFQRKTVHIERAVDFNARGSSSQSAISDVKTRAGVRYVPMPDELTQILLPMRGDPDAYLVAVDGKPLTYNLFRTRFAHLMMAAGMLQVSPKYHAKAEQRKAAGKPPIAPNPSYDYVSSTTPHRFRHHYITSLVEAEVRPEVVMSIVGHRSYSTTVEIYTHIQQLMRDAEPTLLSSALAHLFARNLPVI